MDSGSFYKNAKSRPFQTVFIFTQNNKKTLDSQGFHQSAPGRTRTGDLRITNALLYQLSHGSTFKKCCCITQQQVTCPGIEPGFTPWEGVVLTAWPTGRNRGDKIRTCDLCVPNAALYQTEPRLDVLERLFCAVYQRLVYNSMTLKKMQAFFWKNFNFLKKSFFGESSGIKKNLTKPYFIRKNSNRWVWESCAASRKKNVRKVHRNQKIRKETWKFNKNQQEFSHLYRWWDELPSLA